MAKIVFGPIVSEARGKQGNVSFSRSGSGAISRQCPVWPDPNTETQQYIRGLMKAVHIAWGSTLTEGQRSAWRTLAQKMPCRDRFSQAFYQAGQTLFTQCSMNSLLAGGNRIDTAATTLSAPDPGALTATASAAASTLTVTPTTPMPPGHGLIVLATRSISEGILNFNSWLRQLRPSLVFLFTDTFPGGTFIPPWTCHGGSASNWSESDNQLHALHLGSLITLWQGSALWSAYTMTFQLQRAGSGSFTQGPGVFVNPTTGASYYFSIRDTHTHIALYRQNGWNLSGGYFQLQQATYNLNTDWHTWLIDVTTSNIQLSIDAVPVIAFTDTTLATGAIAFMSQNEDYNVQDLSVTGYLNATLVLPDLGPAYIAKFGPMTPGKQIGILLSYVNLTTGAKSPAQSALITIGA